jgi:hypothetical protein
LRRLHTVPHDVHFVLPLNTIHLWFISAKLYCQFNQRSNNLFTRNCSHFAEGFTKGRTSILAFVSYKRYNFVLDRPRSEGPMLKNFIIFARNSSAIGVHFTNSHISRVSAVKLLNVCNAAAVREMDTTKSQQLADGSKWTFLFHHAIKLPVPTGYKFW